MSSSPYIDEWGVHLGYCNHCGEEGDLHSQCCAEGEMVPYDDDPEPNE